MVSTYTVILTMSAILNFFLGWKLRQKMAPRLTIEAKEVLKALGSSTAVLSIKVVDPGDFFLLSPRDIGGDQ